MNDKDKELIELLTPATPEQVRALAAAFVPDQEIGDLGVTPEQLVPILKAEIAELRKTAREIKGLKTRVRNLTAQLKRKDTALFEDAAASAPFTMRGKLAKALHEQTTSPEARHAALLAWNGIAKKPK